MKITITVTQDDINAAKGYLTWGGVGRSTNCPIARAARRALPNYLPHVGLDSISFEKTNTLFYGEARLPEIAWVFRYEFDSGHKVEPFSFELDVDLP